MQLSEYPRKDWIGKTVKVRISTGKVSGAFSYEGKVEEVSGNDYRCKNPRALVVPPNCASFIRAKWVKADDLEVVETEQ